MKAQFFLCFALTLFSFAEESHPKGTTHQSEDFQPFTGTINSQKVRIRTSPDIESTIVTTYDDGKYLTIVGKVDDFYAIEPTSDTKLYVYKNFVVDGKIEGHNVNVRLAPDLNSPIIAKLQQDDVVEAKICENHPQWMEIAVPKEIEFFVAQEYVDKAGDVDFLARMDAKKEKTVSQLDALKDRIAKEKNLPFDAMDIRECEHIAEKLFQELDHDTILEVKDLLHSLKESYLSKKIASLEMQLKREELPEMMVETIEPLTIKLQNVPEEYHEWYKREFDCYLAWSEKNPSKSFDTFLMYEKDGATLITGTVERFECDLDHIPGNYLLVQNGYPVAYLYSLDDSLEKHIGQEISFLGRTRNNLDFAFPTFVVLEIK